MSMTTKISVPLSEVDEKFLKELKEKYPSHTRLDIQVVNLDDIPTFTEEDFWSIIGLLDWNAETRNEVLTPAVEALAQHPASHIYLFEDILAEKLYALDTKAHARAAYPKDSFSEDGFLYVRAAVVAQGKEKYKQILQGPAQINPDEDFEPLLSLAALAYEQKTGSEFDYPSPTSYETYANEASWQ
ncbi:MAG: DUF4240 domain-containing protein [Lewinellaceae bacterium]|nr:DUF4240 domain-containing protein [Lewinellaceae bacterium]MCB9040368.1 DUF4240 domain-containing protein [Lewinellaceae bacterium]